MFQDHITVKNRHKKFIKNVSETETVYALKNKTGFATSSSVHYEDEDGNPIGLICFWSESARAKSCIKDGWNEYELAEITLVEFMENWCVGMENDGLLLGTQFDNNMFGFEAEPYELILDLVDELKSLGKDLDFRKFSGIQDLEKQVKAVLE
ncbi:DUF2750 domain-containing protein [Flagellimonas okinawensis]|uniref:DUF2750 domain-containing protein n=1 Tax=Flagellimonas okinawensis TaxID=3031324 RepID=A0ABT5XQV3_9FLAO|nr:DUF2750 domain-containing protein [[Muricauda] okinawensis]MDF0708273.1 DUF2750 domain-containing protein [[Muricauda] okinawensis]